MKKTALGILSLLGCGAYTAQAQMQPAHDVVVNVRFHPVFTIILQNKAENNAQENAADMTQRSDHVQMDHIMHYLEVNSTTCFQVTETSSGHSDDVLVKTHQSPIKGLMVDYINIADQAEKMPAHKTYTLMPL